jgi:zinc D-Ala-D-Ala carboxypeptidase
LSKKAFNMSKKKFKEEFLKSLNSEVESIDSGITEPLIDNSSLSQPAHLQPLRPPFYRKPIFWSINLMVLASIFLVFAGLGVYAQNRRENQDKSLAECQNALTKAAKIGVDTQNVNCQTGSNPLDLFWGRQTEAGLIEAKTTLERRESDLLLKTETLDRRINNLKTSLARLGVDPSSRGETGGVPAENFEQTDLARQIEQKQNYIAYLEKFLQDNLQLLGDAVSSFEKLMQINPDLDFTAEKKVLEDFKSLNQESQIEGYKNFLEEYVKLQDKTQKAKPTGRRTIGTAELGKYKTFTAAEFMELYDRLNYPKIKAQNSDTPLITGNQEADKQIISIAEKRGYRRRGEAVAGGLVGADGQTLQSQAKEAWVLMKQAANREGVSLGLVSGFRSVDMQRSIFKDALQQVSIQRVGRTYTAQEIASGQADEAINAVLETRSIPGYSKHHTGFTIDITDKASGMQFTAFRNTPAFDWISANNYYNAKRFGFIPSYPVGGTNFGPEPEAWEYVWVGEDRLIN